MEITKLELSKTEKLNIRMKKYLINPLSFSDDLLKIIEILKDIKNTVGIKIKEYKHHGEEVKQIIWYNIPCSFDIETTQTKHGAYMYIWQFNIFGYTIYGRTWGEFNQLTELLYRFLDLKNCHLVCYIQNISYEYQFIRMRFRHKITKVFATDRRTIIYFDFGNLHFKDSYCLFGCSLEKIGNDLQYFPYRKTKDLDYLKLRNSKTKLTKKELNYCLLDVIVLSCAIWEKILQHKKIFDIPLTKTGYVRRYLREFMFRDAGYKNIVRTLTLTENQYLQAKRAFMGGFSHGNCLYNGIPIKNVVSHDECSEYPFTELAYLFPMKFIGNKDSIKYEDIPKIERQGKVGFIADIEIQGLKPIENICDNIISKHKCKIEGKYIENNGRLVSAGKIYLSLTNIDIWSISRFYTWDKIFIRNVNIYLLGYLPKSLLIAIIELFRDKNTLKGVKGEEQNYKLKKELLNSNYGAMVEDIIKLFLEFNEGNLYCDSIDIEKQLEKYNNSNKRFNFYLWGVFITAYARRDLYFIFDDMKTAGVSDMYLLSDTDSIKHYDHPIIDEIIKKHNKRKYDLINKMCDTMCIPDEYRDILNKYGIGQFEVDDKYLIFKEFGAKRYCYINKDFKLGVTVAGLPKKAIKKLSAKYGKYKVFEMIEEDIIFNTEDSCKNCHSFFDFETKEIINGEEMQEETSIVILPTTFKMGYSTEFETFLESVPFLDYDYLLNKYV